MNKFLSIFLCVFLAGTLLAGNHPSLKFENISSPQGLSQNSVYTLLQDRQGFLWMGTEDGLNRYDGYSFRIYTTSLEQGFRLTNNTITALAEDKNGILWIGTYDSRINAYNSSTGRIKSFPLLSEKSIKEKNARITTIFLDTREMLWVGTTHGLYSLPLSGIPETVWSDSLKNTPRLPWTHYKAYPETADSLPNGNVTSITEDADGRLWIGTYGSGLVVFRPGQKSFKRFRLPENKHKKQKNLFSDHIQKVYRDRDGVLWIGTNGGGLFSLNTVSGTVKHFGNDPENPRSLQSNFIYSIFQDSDGLLWFGTKKGISRFLRDESGKISGFLNIEENPLDPYGLRGTNFISIYEDRSKVLWFGSDGFGLNKFSKKSSRFNHIFRRPLDKNSLSSNDVFAIYKDTPGMLWVGTTGGGLDRMNFKTGRTTHYRNNPENPASLSIDDVATIYEDSIRGKNGERILWIGTYDGGLDKLNIRTGKFVHYRHDPRDSTSISSNQIRAVLRDQEGKLWIGTEEGLNLFDDRTGTFKRFRSREGDPQSLAGDYIFSIMEDNKGDLWFGTLAGGISLLTRENRRSSKFINFRNNPQAPSSLSNNGVFSICQDRSGVIWIGTFGGGLNKFDRESGAFSRFTMEDGLPNDVVYGILEDNAGYLWISTNRGLSRFDPRRKKFVNFTRADGLQENEFNAGAYFKSSDGELYFGGINGITHFYPENLKPDSLAAPLVLTNFKKFNKVVQLDSSIYLKKKIFLNYRENVISFEFASLDFNAPFENQYKYFLEGFSRDWTFLGNKRDITFTNLNPGTYKLRIQGTNSGGFWNPQEASIMLFIKPPYWQTTGFRISIGTLFVLLIVLIFKQRTRSLRRSKIVLEKEVRRRTAELEVANQELKSFAYSVSHDLRAPLRSIDGFSLALLEDYADSLDDTARNYLNRVRASSQKMSRLIDALLMLSRVTRREMQEEEVNLSRLATEIVNNLRHSDPKRSIQIEIENDLTVRGDDHLLGIVLENLIGNAWKFTGKSDAPRIEFGVIQNAKGRVFFVKDNGAGFDMEYAENLFQPFQRLHSQDEFEGTGIGLATVRRVVERHHGRVWAEGEPGKGATVFFTLS